MRKRSWTAVAMVAAAAAMAVTLSSAGCRTLPNLFLNVFGLEKPVNVALVTENALDTLALMTPYDGLMQALGKEIGRPVLLEPVFAFQAGPNLCDGLRHLALAPPALYVQLQGRDLMPVLAAPGLSEAQVARPAVLVVKSDSPVKAVTDLRGQRLAFGPRTDSRTYNAALTLLVDSGFSPTDIAGDIPLLQDIFWRHVASVRARTQLVLDGTVKGAFLDQADWEALPERDERANEPCRSKLRVVGQTLAIPDLLVCASPKLGDDLRVRVQNYLLQVGTQNPDVVKPMHCAGFWKVSPEVVDNCRRLVIDEGQTSGPQPTATSAPASGTTP